MVLNTKRLAVAGACALMGALAAVPSADAAFTLADCAGSNVAGRGASFQATAQSTWANGFKSYPVSLEPTACPGSPTGSYDPAGSGAGRSAFGGGSTGGARDASIRFIGYDEAPTATEQAQIEAGTASTTDNGNLLTIPVTSAAITTAVNVPDSCTISGNPSNALIEQAFRGATTVDTWGELYPAIAGTGSKTTAQCAATPITRVVRLDSSGTTFQEKAFLDQVNPGDLDPSTAGVQTWRSLPGESGQTEYGNTVWPNGSTNLVRGTVNGAGSLADKLIATDGGIGYLDLATARSKSFAATGDKRWLSLQDAGGTFRAPTVGSRGSNCAATQQYNNVPANAEADWSQVYGAIPASGYPACALTYVGIWDDYADVYGNTAAEQANHRTVKDYVEFALSSTGQADAVSNDYGALPSAIKTIANNGVAQSTWNKP